jgi:hypothetical protein
MKAPETRYALSGDVHIAYQVVGDGPLDLVFIPSLTHHVELVWENPPQARFFGRLASIGRLLLFDKRGTGMSGPGGRDASARGTDGTTSERSWTPLALNARFFADSATAGLSAPCSQRRIRSGRPRWFSSTRRRATFAARSFLAAHACRAGARD